ncbi:unnamed protein product [Diatraea saccharalis]|uniref:FLYWCH-type domain-containing protein n=1 Tax=Diatraea saccharalis TaxID=40085 RepID=A0A9N9R105_9NEOP|nr:unnamed protein product [Diatraea saccharalis]
MLITQTNGKKLILFEEYTFLNTGKVTAGLFKWKCTDSDCTAYLLVTHNLDILKTKHKHAHDTPKYKKTPRGFYDFECDD